MMFNSQNDKPAGYEYPRPSIDRGQTPVLKACAAVLSAENVKKLVEKIREPQPQE